MIEDRIHDVWACELDQLELEVIRAERLVKGLGTMPTAPWSPPSIPGQMPAGLAARAQDLLDRQERAAVELRVALATAQKQVAYAARLTAVTSNPSAPVYFDLEA